MRTPLKIIVIIGILIACTLIGALINGGNGKAPIFVLVGGSAAIRAVWKYKPADETKKSNVENLQLDKI